jgi:hypothetical protein
MPDLDKVYDLISKVALREELELRSVGSGIFSIQEEAFVYMVGKEIANNSKVLSDKNIRWYTEKKIDNNSGITDLVFEVYEDDEWVPLLAMEFKTRRNEGTCKGDVEKLGLIGHKCKKLFCALVDKKHGEPKDWFGDLGGNKPVPLNKGVFDYFSTIDYRTDYNKSSKQSRCIVVAWEVV